MPTIVVDALALGKSEASPLPADLMAFVRQCAAAMVRAHRAYAPQALEVLKSARQISGAADDILTNSENSEVEPEDDAPSDILTNSEAGGANPANQVSSDNLTKSRKRKSYRREGETLSRLRLSHDRTARQDKSPPVYKGYDTPHPDPDSLAKNRHTTPPLWRDLTARKKVQLWHEMVRGSGAGHGFTLTFSPEIEDKARADKRGPLYFIQQKLSRDLKKAVGYQPAWWACLEEGDRAGRLHIHGGVIILGEDRRLVTDALLNSADHNPGALRWERKTNNGWAQYAAKNVKLNHARQITASTPLNEMTKTAYERWRADALERTMPEPDWW